MSDINELKSKLELTEKEFLECQNKYANLFDKMEEGFATCQMIWDDKGNPVDFRYLDVNTAWEKQTGIPKEKVVGRTVHEVIPTIEPFWINTYAQVVRTGLSVRIENEVKELDRWFEVHAYKIEDDKFAAIFIDITPQKKTELSLNEKIEELERINRVMIDRELEMVKLKEQLDSLK